ncbi:GYD domain-containing protein [Burkholderia sp. Bp8963]|uniref:GYD domain-containing protein n=1 Tax=Burkholderia sp. Bp8963 TaxID=2184547 RepID=UPI000F5961EF|nr:GYD domain-containing protein [Burkholderia sp. Bp8963]RQS62171.1 GYD domain-containing protein [Burkholderia sp. Bp8963]
MTTYVILSRLSPDAFKDPKDLKQLAATVAEKIKAECPAVTWKDSYLTLGRFDVLDVVESDDLKQLERAALIIRAYGHATTETLQATPRKEFIATL